MERILKLVTFMLRSKLLLRYFLFLNLISSKLFMNKNIMSDKSLNVLEGQKKDKDKRSILAISWNLSGGGNLIFFYFKSRKTQIYPFFSMIFNSEKELVGLKIIFNFFTYTAILFFLKEKRGKGKWLYKRCHVLWI